jgi:hypothetical protein
MGGGIRPSTNRLSDRAIKAFLAQARAGTAPKKKLFDGGGLYLTLTPAGTAVWRLKYRIGGRERLVAAGVHPANGHKAGSRSRLLKRGESTPGTDSGDVGNLRDSRIRRPRAGGEVKSNATARGRVDS